LQIEKVTANCHGGQCWSEAEHLRWRGISCVGVCFPPRRLRLARCERQPTHAA